MKYLHTLDKLQLVELLAYANEVDDSDTYTNNDQEEL